MRLRRLVRSIPSARAAPPPAVKLALFQYAQQFGLRCSVQVAHFVSVALRWPIRDPTRLPPVL
jgi:hypothetical protein